MEKLFQVKTYVEIWMRDLVEFVQEYYSKPWDPGQCDPNNGGQNTYIKLDIDPQDWPHGQIELDNWLAIPWEPKPEAERQWPSDDGSLEYQRDPSKFIGIETILWDLCRKEVIPVGNYLIVEWW